MDAVSKKPALARVEERRPSPPPPRASTFVNTAAGPAIKNAREGTLHLPSNKVAQDTQSEDDIEQDVATKQLIAANRPPLPRKQKRKFVTLDEFDEVPAPPPILDAPPPAKNKGKERKGKESRAMRVIMSSSQASSVAAAAPVQKADGGGGALREEDEVQGVVSEEEEYLNTLPV